MNIETNSIDTAYRNTKCLKYGLELESSWDDIWNYEFSVYTKNVIRNLNIPNNTDWDDIWEVIRQKRALELKLRIDSTWDDICEAEIKIEDDYGYNDIEGTVWKILDNSFKQTYNE